MYDFAEQLKNEKERDEKIKLLARNVLIGMVVLPMLFGFVSHQYDEHCRLIEANKDKHKHDVYRKRVNGLYVVRAWRPDFPEKYFEVEFIDGIVNRYEEVPEEISDQLFESKNPDLHFRRYIYGHKFTRIQP